MLWCQKEKVANSVATQANAQLALLGAAWGIGAQNHACRAGPIQLRDEHCFKIQTDLKHTWRAMISANADNGVDVIDTIAHCCDQLSLATQACVREHKPFLTIGGDHSCAIGTWYGALSALPSTADLGLLWIDAHMDSHTPETSPSQCVHGMPLACLLGYGDKRLVHLNTKRVLKPQHVCLVGVRSFEPAEQMLLQRLGVRVFMMDEVKQRGLAAVLCEALALVNQGTRSYGVSIDLDGFDPHQVPGVGSPVKEGLDVATCCDVFRQLHDDPHLLGVEIAEYNPTLDDKSATQRAVIKLAESFFTQFA